MRFAIIFLSRLDRHGQIILAWGDQAVVSHRVGAIGVISLIEIQHQGAALNIVYRAIDVTTCAIAIVPKTYPSP